MYVLLKYFVFREPDILTIELKRDNPLESLGFTVAGYRTADGRFVLDILSLTLVKVFIKILILDSMLRDGYAEQYAEQC